MSCISDYKRQFGWRDWRTVFEVLPSLHGRLLLDLGCGVGDLAAEFGARGPFLDGEDVVFQGFGAFDQDGIY